MGRVTPESIREHRAILRGVERGEITPHCQRAQRAAQVVERYERRGPPRHRGRSVGRLVKPYEEWDGDEVPPVPSLPEISPSYRPRPGRVASTPPVVQRSASPPQEDVLLRVLFGRAAPQARGAVNFFTTNNGQKLLGIGGVAVAAVLLAD